MTARNTNVKDRSMTRVRAELVRKFRMFSSSRTRATDAPRLEIGDRQGQQVAEQASAELDVDAVRGVCKYICPQDGEDRFEDRDRHETDDDHLEGAETAVNQD